MAVAVLQENAQKNLQKNKIALHNICVPFSAKQSKLS